MMKPKEDARDGAAGDRSQSGSATRGEGRESSKKAVDGGIDVLPIGDGERWSALILRKERTREAEEHAATMIDSVGISRQGRKLLEAGWVLRKEEERKGEQEIGPCEDMGKV